jgi:hypothetical protein
MDNKNATKLSLGNRNIKDSDNIFEEIKKFKNIEEVKFLTLIDQ